MNDFSQSAFSSLGTVVNHPLALIGYLGLIISFTIIALKERRFKYLLENIKSLPEKDRREAIIAEIGIRVPDDLSPEQWVRDRKEKYKLIRHCIMVGAIIIIVAILSSKIVNGGDHPPRGDSPGNSSVNIESPVINSPIITAPITNSTITITSDPEIRKIIEDISKKYKNIAISQEKLNDFFKTIKNEQPTSKEFVRKKAIDLFKKYEDDRNTILKPKEYKDNYDGTITIKAIDNLICKKKREKKFMTYDEAVRYANNNSPWRLPTQTELMEICFFSRENPNILKNTGEWYWSINEDVNFPSLKAWKVNGGYAKKTYKDPDINEVSTDKKARLAVRLVRDEK